MKPLSLNMDRYHKVADDGESSTLRQHNTGHEITIAHKALPREQRSFLKALPLYSDANEGASAPVKAPSGVQSKGLDAQGQGYAKGGGVSGPFSPGEKGDAVELAGDKEKYNENQYVESNPNYKKEIAQAFQAKRKGKGHKPLADAFQKRANYASPDAPVSQDDSPQTPININIGGQGGAAPPLPSPDEFQGNLNKMQGGDTDNAPYGTGDTQYGTNVPLPVAPPPETASNDVDYPPEKAGEAIPDTQATRAPANETPQPATNVAQNSPSNPAGTAVPSLLSGDQSGAGTNPSFVGGLKEQIQGGQLGAKAAGQLGKAQAPILEKQAASIRDTVDNIKQANDSMSNERALLANDLRDGKIGPEHYWDNHSKIATGLGMIIAGFNPTNRPNAAIDFLNKSIDQDTQSQTAKLGQRNDLLGHYVNQFGNQQQATEFTNSAKKDAAASELEAAAAKMADPVARARNMQLAGQLRQSAGQALLPYAMANGIQQSISQGIDLSPGMAQLQSVNKPLADYVQSITLPGQGYFSQPISQGVRDQITAKSNIINASQNMRDFLAANSKGGVFNPLKDPRVSAAAQTYGNELHQIYRQAVGASTSESEKKDISDVVGSDPTSMFAKFIGDPKLKALEGSIGASIDNIKKQYGFTPLRGVQQPTQQATQQQSRAAVPDKNGKLHVPMVGKDGKIYMVPQ